jgi:hypothetical protein
MKLKYSEKDIEIFRDIRRMTDESRKINQILNSDDFNIDLLKLDLRRQKRKNNTKSLPNLIYNQGNNIPFKTSSLFKKTNKKIQSTTI